MTCPFTFRYSSSVRAHTTTLVSLSQVTMEPSLHMFHVAISNQYVVHLGGRWKLVGGEMTEREKLESVVTKPQSQVQHHHKIADAEKTSYGRAVIISAYTCT